jgi:hypothetical protein
VSAYEAIELVPFGVEGSAVVAVGFEESVEPNVRSGAGQRDSSKLGAFQVHEGKVDIWAMYSLRPVGLSTTL